jgi:hypothetical protein
MKAKVLREFIKQTVNESLDDTSDIQRLWFDYKRAKTFLSANRDLIAQYQAANWPDVLFFVEDYAERLKEDRGSPDLGSFPSEMRSEFPGLKLHSEVGMGDSSISWLALVLEDLRTRYPNMSPSSLSKRVDSAVRRFTSAHSADAVSKLLRRAEEAQAILASGEGKFSTVGDQEAYEYGVRGDHYTVTHLPDKRSFKVGGRSSDDPGSLGT